MALADEYVIARLLLLRCVGAIYLLAFVVVVSQCRPLLGEHGLEPAPAFLRGATFRQVPSLFVWRYSDRLLLAVGWLGIALSAAVVAGLVVRGPPLASMGVSLLRWVLYLPAVNIGEPVCGVGWEALLPETGVFCAIL